ncbi:hypothetical protein A9Q83_13950 [Alphaproteobacteria bacterium 46_93_T64]|nr:hypothetical protein A9Q83_13950 [Alphaproteobacteria bacterium 46_93_T64]
MIKDISISASLGIASTLFLSLSLIGAGENAVNTNAFQALSLMTLSVIPLFIAGLGWGLTGGVVSVVTGAVVAAAFIAPLFSLTYVLTCGLPVLAITRQSLLWREENEKIFWYPVSNLFGVWVLVSITLSCMAIALLYMNEELRNALITQFDQIIPQLQKQGGVFATVTAEKVVWLMPQFFGPFWGIVLMMGGCLAQGVLVRFKKNVRPSPEFSGLKMPKWVAIVTIGVFVFGTFFNVAEPIIGAVVLTLEIVFFLQGIGVIHRVSRSWKFRSAMLAAVYLIMILMFWPVLVVALLGLVDSWVGFRERLDAIPSQEED